MKKSRIIYFFVTLIFVILSIFILSKTDISNNVLLSKSIQMILILFLIRISIGCFLYIKKLYNKQKYSYDIVMNLGLLIFINVNILRQINLLIQNWNVLKIIDIYNNTLKSFSFFALLTLPCIIFFALFSIITNVILIKKEGFSSKNLLGIILGVLALIGILGSQTLYYVITKILFREDKQFIKYALDICINATLSYLYTLIIATLYCNIKAGKHVPKYDKDFVIILGSKINSDGSLTPLLKGRVDKAIEFATNQYENTNKKIIYVPSGGQGADEIISEAEAIKNYLIEHGVNKNQILIEDKSTSTVENMKFSKNIIFEKNNAGNIIFSTTNYHVFRSGIIANNQGIDCEGIGSKTKWYFYTNALIREFIANLFQERTKHIILLLLINISLLILIIIGKYSNFLNIINY
ncbi:MAG: YdcF family protein [Bacilli bacterium]|nr:YdcF family protein [Bacilli bacterium]